MALVEAHGDHTHEMVVDVFNKLPNILNSYLQRLRLCVGEVFTKFLFQQRESQSPNFFPARRDSPVRYCTVANCDSLSILALGVREFAAFDESCKSVFSLLANIYQSKDPAFCQEAYLEDLVQDLLQDHSEDDQSCCLEEFRGHEESSKKRR